MNELVSKIPGGFRVDGLELKTGKCGCMTVLPCCYSWSKVRMSGNSLIFSGKATSPDTKDSFTWGYIVNKGDLILDVTMEDARDKVLFSGYYPPRVEDWIAKGWQVIRKQGNPEDHDVWRCAACKWLYKEHQQKSRFEDLTENWKCPICLSGKDVFEKIL